MPSHAKLIAFSFLILKFVFWFPLLQPNVFNLWTSGLGPNRSFVFICANLNLHTATSTEAFSSMVLEKNLWGFCLKFSPIRPLLIPPIWRINFESPLPKDHVWNFIWFISFARRSLKCEKASSWVKDSKQLITKVPFPYTKYSIKKTKQMKVYDTQWILFKQNLKKNWNSV